MPSGSDQLANRGRAYGPDRDRGLPNVDRDGGHYRDTGRDHGSEYGHHDERPQIARRHDRDEWEHHRPWNGGYWHGRYWPAIHDRSDFVWFLPALPAYYTTYWWDGVPYYYYDDAYYTWDDGYGGYVATEPPPVDDSGAAAYPPDTSAALPNEPGELYAYPMQGQTPEQQVQDRRQCEQWAASQSPAVAGPDSPDYTRALKACLTGRGYSVD